MCDLFVQVSWGSGYTVKDNNVCKMYYNSPGLLKDSDDYFDLYVFGHCINPYVAKSPLFRCRDLFSHLHCYFAGLKRDSFRSANLTDAVSCLVSCVPDSVNKDLVIIESSSFDFTSSDIDDLLDNLYSIISKALGSPSNLAIVWHLSDEELAVIKEHKSWSTNCELLDDENYRALVLY